MTRIGEFESYWNSENCATCGSYNHIDPSHIIPRSQAPDRVHDPYNIIPQCRTCHELKDTKRMVLEQKTDGSIWWVNPNTGEYSRRYNSNPNAVMEALAAIQVGSLDKAAQALMNCDDEELKNLNAHIVDNDHMAKYLQSAIWDETQQRSAYGDKWDQAAADAYGFSKSLIRRRAKMWAVFYRENHGRQEHPINMNISWQQWLSNKADDPEKALQVALDMLAENPKTPWREIAEACGIPLSRPKQPVCQCCLERGCPCLNTDAEFASAS